MVHNVRYNHTLTLSYWIFNSLKMILVSFSLSFFFDFLLNDRLTAWVLVGWQFWHSGEIRFQCIQSPLLLLSLCTCGFSSNCNGECCISVAGTIVLIISLNDESDIIAISSSVGFALGTRSWAVIIDWGKRIA